jgi:glycosyltransferase involved in cell wall biosynthesis
LTDPAPRLSVLLPTWNAAATVERALASILVEREIALECLVIDDASTDATADIVAAVAERDPRVSLLRLDVNGGVSNARNRGLEMAAGAWLAFLDADDVILPGGLAAIMRPTADPTVLAVVGQRVQYDGQRRWLSRRYDQPDITQPGRKSIATHPGLMSYAAIHGKAFRRSLTEGLRFEGRVLGDQPWTISALLRAGDHIEVIADVVYEWFRPPADGYVEGITAATRASTTRATAMALRAPIVYAAVSDEVNARIADPGARQRVKRAYFERLVQSDLGVALDDALKRRDPATTTFLAAVAGYLEAIPAEVRAASTVAADRLLMPPADRWSSLVRGARSSYWQVARAVLRSDPRPTRRIARGRAAVPAFAIVRRFDGRLADVASSAAMSAASLGRRFVRRAKRARS